MTTLKHFDDASDTPALFEPLKAARPTTESETQAGHFRADPALNDSYSGVDGDPLTAEHKRQMTDADSRFRRLRRAGRVASFNGWSLGIFAALSAPFALFSLPAFVVCLALALVAWNEFHGRNLLKQFDRRGPRFLGWNQLGLMGFLIAYSVWNIVLALSGPNPYAEQMQATPEVASLLGSVGDLYSTVTLAVYGSLIVASLVFQGLNAVYYFTRQQHLQAYLEQTPPWIVDVQRSAAMH